MLLRRLLNLRVSQAQSSSIRSIHTTSAKGFQSHHPHLQPHPQTRQHIIQQHFQRRTKTTARQKLIAKNDALILENAVKFKKVEEEGSLLSILNPTAVFEHTKSKFATGGVDTDNTATSAVIPKKRGRLKGSKNKPKNDNLRSSTSTVHIPAKKELLVSMGKKKTGGKKYYAVRVGRQVGVFGTWTETQALVNGFKGSKYKSFPTLEQAEAFVRGDNTGGGVTPSAAKASASAAHARYSTSAAATQDPESFMSRKRKATDGASSSSSTRHDTSHTTRTNTIIDAMPVLDASQIITPLSQPPQPPIKKVKITRKKWKASCDSLPSNALQIFTDGSCLVNNGTTPAGWGAVCVRPIDKEIDLDADSEDEDNVGVGGGIDIWQICGPVVTKPNRPDYIFAEKASNNTGELCGIINALKHVMNREDNEKPVIIRADSQYAMKCILGLFNNISQNKKLVLYGQEILEKVRETRVVEFEHVKAHNNHKWNDLADELANKGRCMPQ